MSTTPRRPHRSTRHRWARVCTFLTGVAAALAMMLGAALPAAAQTKPDDFYKPVLPYDAIGVLGNPANIVPVGAPSQAVTIPAGAGWGTPLRNQNATGGAEQKWQFSLVGQVTVPYRNVNYPTPGKTLQMPVWKIVNQQNGNRTCLEANGSGPVGPGTSVDFYGCDPNALNQPNQLWIIAGNAQLWAGTTAGGSTFPASSGSQLYTGPEGGLIAEKEYETVAIISYDSFLSNGNDLPHALVVTGANHSGGMNSPLSLQSQQDRPTANKLWTLKDVGPKMPTPSGSGSDQNCRLYGCLVKT